MTYEFICTGCLTKRNVQRSVADRNCPLLCTCGLFMHRRIARVTLITRRAIDEPECKYAAGFAATDRLEEIKREARSNEEAAGKPATFEPKSLDSISSDVMADCLERVGL